MKIQKAVRMQTMFLAGVAAALLLAAPVRAQQETDPTYFDFNSGTPRAEHRAPVRTAAHSTLTEKKQMQSADFPAFQDATLEANLVRVTLAEVAALTILFGGVILIVLYAMAATRREGHTRAFPGSTAPPLA
jgi:hypothetical protein